MQAHQHHLHIKGKERAGEKIKTIKLQQNRPLEKKKVTESKPGIQINRLTIKLCYITQ